MTAPAAAVSKDSSFVEDIVDVFYAPSAVFERRRTRGYALPLLLYALLTAALVFAARPVLRPMMDRQRDKTVAQIQSNPQLSAEQKEAAAKRIDSAFNGPFAMIGPIVVIPITIFVTAFALWICGKFFGSAATYGQAAMVTTFASFPRLLLGALVTGYSLVTGRETTSQFGITMSPALLMPDDSSPVMMALASRLDLGVLWATALLGIGIAITGRMKRSYGIGAAVMVWLLGGLLVVAFAFREMAT